MAIVLLSAAPFAVVDADMPVIPAAQGGVCVAPSDIMRRDHMQLLNHQRDRTVINGIRGEKFSLNGCVSCHVQKDTTGEYIPINAEQQFCQSCHEFASVKIDCFECHRTTPDHSSPDHSAPDQ